VCVTHRTRFELFYTKRSLFRFYERFARVVGTFCLFPETEVKPLDELRLDIDDDDDYDGEAGVGHRPVGEGRAGSHSSGSSLFAVMCAILCSLAQCVHLQAAECALSPISGMPRWSLWITWVTYGCSPISLAADRQLHLV
jgi:hypothetical protein